MALPKALENYVISYEKEIDMISGKTAMVWNVPAIDNKSPEKFIEKIAPLNLEGVMLKVADGNSVHKMKSYSPWPDWGESVKEDLVEALKEANYDVYLWHFLYGYDPIGELNIARSQTNRFKPKGYVWNVEGSFDNKKSAVNNATLISKGFKESNPNVSQGLCWWALPKSPVTGVQWHPIDVAKAFLNYSDVGMPMMYWQGSSDSNAIMYLEKSTDIWRTFTTKPLHVIGRSYNGDGGIATGSAINVFGNKVYQTRYSNGYVGNSWYSLDKTLTNPDWFSSISLLPKWNIGPPEIELSLEEKVDRLVKDHLPMFPELV